MSDGTTPRCGADPRAMPQVARALGSAAGAVCPLPPGHVHAHAAAWDQEVHGEQYRYVVMWNASGLRGMRIEQRVEDVSNLPDEAYLSCERCGWQVPIATTNADERCSECGGAFVAVVEPGPSHPIGWHEGMTIAFDATVVPPMLDPEQMRDVALHHIRMWLEKRGDLPVTPEEVLLFCESFQRQTAAEFGVAVAKAQKLGLAVTVNGQDTTPGDVLVMTGPAQQPALRLAQQVGELVERLDQGGRRFETAPDVCQEVADKLRVLEHSLTVPVEVEDTRPDLLAAAARDWEVAARASAADAEHLRAAVEAQKERLAELSDRAVAIERLEELEARAAELERRATMPATARRVWFVTDGRPGPNADVGPDRDELVRTLRRHGSRWRLSAMGRAMQDAADELEKVGAQFVELEDDDGRGVGSEAGARWEERPEGVGTTPGLWRLGPFVTTRSLEGAPGIDDDQRRADVASIEGALHICAMEGSAGPAKAAYAALWRLVGPPVTPPAAWSPTSAGSAPEPEDEGVPAKILEGATSLVPRWDGAVRVQHVTVRQADISGWHLVTAWVKATDDHPVPGRRETAEQILRTFDPAGQNAELRRVMEAFVAEERAPDDAGVPGVAAIRARLAAELPPDLDADSPAIGPFLDLMAHNLAIAHTAARARFAPDEGDDALDAEEGVLATAASVLLRNFPTVQTKQAEQVAREIVRELFERGRVVMNADEWPDVHYLRSSLREVGDVLRQVLGHDAGTCLDCQRELKEGLEFVDRTLRETVPRAVAEGGPEPVVFVLDAQQSATLDELVNGESHVCTCGASGGASGCADAFDDLCRFEKFLRAVWDGQRK